jgi:hypothetical protein
LARDELLEAVTILLEVLGNTRDDIPLRSTPATAPWTRIAPPPGRPGPFGGVR